MLLKIAWRNIWRNKTRSLIIIGAVGIGIWAALFLIAFSGGMSAQRISEAIENELGHFQVHHAQFKKEGKDIRFALENGLTLVRHLQQDTLIKAATARLVVPAMANSTVTSTGVEVDGVVPSEENALTHLEAKLVEGSYFEGVKRNPVIISRKLAEQLSVKLHSKIVINFQGPEQNILSGAFRIAGIYETNNSRYDKMHVFARRDDMQNLVGQQDMVNEIAVKLKNADQLEQYVASYRQAHPNLLTETWGDLSPDLELFNSAFDQGMQVFVFIIMLALAFGIINTMLMAVLERVNELGMLMAVGMNKWRVFRMIMTETVFLSLTGSPVGLLLAWASISYFGSYGIDLSMVGQGLGSLGYGSMVYPAIAPHFYLDTVLQVLAVAILAAIYPARKASNLNPIEAIRTT